MKMPPDFREFIELMISSGVRFVMIGGFAYNLYRNPRSTGDIDFLLDRGADNDGRLRVVLEEFGFGDTLPPSSEPLLQPGKIIMLGRSPFRIDLLNQIDGVTFEEVDQTKLVVLLDGLNIPVISPEKLLKNKLASGRAKDLADAEELRVWLNKHDDLR
jgi:hypothetical protein